MKNVRSFFNAFLIFALCFAFNANAYAQAERPAAKIEKHTGEPGPINDLGSDDEKQISTFTQIPNNLKIQLQTGLIVEVQFLVVSNILTGEVLTAYNNLAPEEAYAALEKIAKKYRWKSKYLVYTAYCYKEVSKKIFSGSMMDFF